MKINLLLVVSMRLILLLLCLTFGKQHVFAQDSYLKGDESYKMSLEAEFDKNSYLQFEPLFLKLRLINKTAQPLTIIRPNLLLAKIKIESKDGSRKFDQITWLNIYSISTSFETYQPGEFFEEEITVTGNKGMFFPEPGYYQVQFQFYVNEEQLLESNLIEITIENPEGINKQAFDFLNKHGKDPWFNDVVSDEKDGFGLLKTFVDKYSASVYGEYAISTLGYYYYYSKESDLNKAKAEFEKLKLSKNPIIVKQAKKSLDDIERTRNAIRTPKIKQSN